jgi:type IV secretion system protein VirB5
MKKIVLSALITMSLLNASGIPVVDAVANAQAMAQNIKTVAEYAEQAKRWVDTATHYQSQLKAYNDQLISQTGIRDSVSFIQDIDDFNNFAKSYSKDFLSLENDSINDNGIIGTRVKELGNKYNLYNECEGSHLSSDEKRICENKTNRRFKEIATYQEYSNNIGGIQNNLDGLTRKLATSRDIKESQDINNAIQLQVAQLEITKSQVQLMNEQNKRMDDIDKQQREQLFRKSMKTNDTRRFTPNIDN